MENYEKRYKDALEAIKKLQEANPSDEGIQNWVNDNFPELAMSEDEKIRKELIEHIKANQGADYVLFQKFSPDDVIAWLEKQKSVEEIIERCKKSWYNEGKIAGMAEGLSDDEKYQQGWHDAIEKQEEKVDNANNIVPKFHEGDWIVQGDNILKIRCVGGTHYCFETVGGYVDDMLVSEIDSQFHLWTIADAKDGDVLAVNNEVFIYAHRKQMYCIAVAHCFVDSAGGFYLGGEFLYEENGTIFPATKEQRDTLMKAMTDAGYAFDFEKKELKKIEPKLKVKYAGSEYNVLEIKEFPGGIIYYGIEDESNHIVYVLPDNCEIISGYGEKEKGSPYPTKPATFSQQNPVWSEEDDYNVQCLAAKVTSDIQNGNVGRNQELIDWLKSLKDRVQPQKQWKPSEEQMDALEHFVRSIGESGYACPYDNDTKLIYSLLEQLKQL